MITKYLFGVAFFLISGVMQPPLGTPTPESIYKFPFTASQQDVYKTLNANVKDFTMSDWLEVEKSVRANNRVVEDKVRTINADLQTAYEQLQQLASSRNIAQIKANLEALKKAKSEMGRIAEERLKPLNYQGLYVAICSNVSSRMPMPDLQKAIQDKFSPDAVKTLNGTFIQSLTELKDNKVEYDYVYEKVSGTMEAIKMEHQERDFGTGTGNGYFVEIWTVRVSPLQKMMSSLQSNSIPANNNGLQIKVIDLYNNSNFTQELQSITDNTFRQKLEQYIQENRSHYVQEITAYNNAMRQDESIILQEIEASIQEHEQKIITVEKNLNESKLVVEKILRQIGVNFDMGNLEQSLSQAETILSKKIMQLSQQKLDEKSKELIFEKFVGVGTAVDPNQEMAQNATAKIQAINKSHSILSSFIQEIAVKDNKVDMANTVTQKDVSREVEYYWVYPIPLGGKFDMGIVAKFRLHDDIQPISLPNPITQTEPINLNNNWWEKYDEIGYFGENLLVVGKYVINKDKREINTIYGIIDRTGKELISPKYQYINSYSLSEGRDFAEVMMNNKNGLVNMMGKEVTTNKYGFVDEMGHIVIPLGYEQAMPFSEGYAWVKKSGYWGGIDKSGNVVIPFEYQEAKPFNEGYAWVKKNDYWGCTDKSGRMVISIEYENANDFSEGLAIVNKNKKWGCINKNGQYIIPCEYDYLGNFRDGDGVGYYEKGGEWGIIDKQGQKKAIGYDDYAGIVWSHTTQKVKVEGTEDEYEYKHFYNDGSGNAYEYRPGYYCDGFREGLLLVHKDEKYGAMDKVGNMVIPLDKYIFRFDFNEGITSFRIDSKWKWMYGYIDKTGKIIVTPTYDWAGDFNEGLAVVGKDQKFGCIDKLGKLVVPLEYDNIQPFRNGLAIASKNEKYGCIDKTGKIIVPFVFSSFHGEGGGGG